jgi:lactobin A/cerein 7B family class IIb bacteriocin
MRDLTIDDMEYISGGVAPAVIFVAKFAAGYIGAFTASAGFALGAADSIKESQ